MLGFASIRGRLTTSYLVLLVLLLLIVGISISRFLLLSNNIRGIVEENAALVELTGELNVNAESLASRLLLLFVLEERDARVAIYKEIDDLNRSMDDNVTKMKSLVKNDEEIEQVNKLEEQRKVYQAALQTTVETLEFGELPDAKQQMAGPTRDELQKFLSQTKNLAEKQSSIMSARQDEVVKESELAIWIIIAEGILSIIIGAAMSLIITRSIVNPISKIVGLLDKMANGDLTATIHIKQKGEIGKLASSVQSMRSSLINVIRKIDSSAKTVVDAVATIRISVKDVEDGSNKQESMAGEIQESVTELSQGVNTMVEHVSVAHNQAEAAHTLAKHGKEVITTAAKDINSVAAYIEETSHSVAKLKESASTVTEFVGNIRNIAEQTNLLALNASIEAARAGESGRGFAVVADEVRNLASNTAEVTASIDQVITAIATLSTQVSDEMAHGQERMRQGVTQIENVVAPLSQLEADSAESLQSLDGLSQLAQLQASEANDISEHITHIVAVTENNSQTSLGLRRLTDDLSGAASQTKEATSTFILPESA